MRPETIQQAKEMLVDLLDRGSSYREAGDRHGIARSTAERQVKALVRSIAAQYPIAGLDDAALSSLVLLRSASAAVLSSMRRFDPKRPAAAAVPWSFDELPLAVRRIRARSENANRDVALLLLLFSSGAKPLEIARLSVDDYLQSDGTVRTCSEIGNAAAAASRARPLYFLNARVCEALDAYLEERSRRRLGTGSTGGTFRGLDPRSALFLTEDGLPFAVKSRSVDDPRPCCPVLIATFRGIFARAGWTGATTQIVRRHVAQRLAERGATRKQLGQLLGLSNSRSVQRLLERKPRPLDCLVRDLV